LKNLPESIEIDIDGIKINLTHGSPDDKREYFEVMHRSKPPPYLRVRLNKWLDKWEIVILGHTHEPFTYRWSKKLAMNPGSVGQPRDGNPNASFGIITVKNSKIRSYIYRLEYNIEKVCRAINEYKLPQFLCERLYDGR
jgi:putative phosphoesterase